MNLEELDIYFGQMEVIVSYFYAKFALMAWKKKGF